jgi:hypothetical protein
MSARHNPTEGPVAPGALPATETPSAPKGTAHSHWRQERLIEARGILADIGHHPDTLVLLACQVICAHSPDPIERTDALGVMRLLNACQLDRASTAPNGGAA